MEFRLKLVTSVALAGLAAACGPAEQGEQAAMDGMDHAAMASGEGGEGEGGEGEAGAAAAMTPDQQHMLRLALIQGHLSAGNELIARGRADMGAGHAAHPRVEIYNSSEAEFVARGEGALGAALDGYLAAVRDGAPGEAREAARSVVNRQLAEAAAKAAFADHAEALSELMSEAASEYGIGVVDGAIVTPHEYQDAWGFMRAGAALFEARRADYDAVDAAAAAEAAAKFEAALAAFPDILSGTPPSAATIRAVTTQAALALYPFRSQPG
jgi:hypothetical protein